MSNIGKHRDKKVSQYETVWEKEDRLSQKRIVEETDGESDASMLMKSTLLCIFSAMAIIGYLGGLWLASKIFN